MENRDDLITRYSISVNFNEYFDVNFNEYFDVDFSAFPLFRNNVSEVMFGWGPEATKNLVSKVKT